MKNNKVDWPLIFAIILMAAFVIALAYRISLAIETCGPDFIPCLINPLNLP